MLRSYLLRLNPTKRQRADLERVLAISCELYNAALQERIEAWKLERKRITFYDQCKELTTLRRLDSDTAWLPTKIAREPLRRVHKAFRGFFERMERGERPGHPRYRSQQRYDSFSLSECRMSGNVLLLPKLGGFRFKCHRSLKGSLRHVTVKRVGRKWQARAVFEVGPAPEKQPVSLAVGIDLGVSEFLTLSDGSSVPNPRWVRQHADKIATAQQCLARKKRGSKNRLKAKERVRRAYQRMANCRQNFTHHASKALIQKYDLIAHEDLKIRNMVRGNLAKSILDAAWGQLLFQLAYKAEEAGRYVVAVNPKGTSQRCSQCGATVSKTLAERQHDCPYCGLSLGRDHNAALNVLRLGRSRVEVSAEGRTLPTTPGRDR